MIVAVSLGFVLELAIILQSFQTQDSMGDANHFITQLLHAPSSLPNGPYPDRDFGIAESHFPFLFVACSSTSAPVPDLEASKSSTRQFTSASRIEALTSQSIALTLLSVSDSASALVGTALTFPDRPCRILNRRLFDRFSAFTKSSKPFRSCRVQSLISSFMSLCLTPLSLN